MNAQLRWAGAGMIIGGLVIFGRMAPIFSILPDDMAFPPTTTPDLIRLAELAGARWQVAHALGYVTVALFTLGYWAHANALAAAGHPFIGRIAAIIASLAFGLFGIALYLDGFVLPNVAQAYSASGPAAPGLTHVQAAHDHALQFFTPAMFLMFIAMGVLSSRMLHGFIHYRWLGWFGMTLAVAAPTAFLFGVTGPNWNNLQIGGSLLMMGYFWHVIVGVASLLGRSVRD